MKERSKPGIGERRALTDDPWSSVDSKTGEMSVSEEIGELLDRRDEALASDPKQKKFTLQEIVERYNMAR